MRRAIAYLRRHVRWLGGRSAPPHIRQTARAGSRELLESHDLLLSTKTHDLGASEVEGEVLRNICCAQDGRRIRISGGYVRTALDLRSASIDVPLEFVGTTFDDEIDLSGSRTAGLRFVECVIRSGVNANGAHIRGDLDLERSIVRGAIETTASTSRKAALWLCEATIDGRLLALGTTIEGRSVGGGLPARSIQGDRLQINGNIRLIQGFTAIGEVRLIAAEIKGSLDLTSCSITDRRLALDLGEATISGSLFLIPGLEGDRSQVVGRVDMSNCVVMGQTLVRATTISVDQVLAEPAYYWFDRNGVPIALRASGAEFRGEVNVDDGCEIDGLMDLLGAEFRSHLNFGDTVFRGETGYSVDLTSASIVGDLKLPKSSTSVRLVNCSLSGLLDGRATVIRSTADSAISARGIRVGGDIRLHEAQMSGGGIDLRFAQISGDLSAHGATIISPSGQSLVLGSARVDGSVFLDQGFVSEGNLNLNRSRIGGRLVCDRGTFRSSGERAALEAFYCVVASGVWLDWSVDGPVYLTGLRTAVLGDDPLNWGSDYRISGLVYERFSDRQMPSAANLESRLAWLEGQSGLDPSTYDQLAGYYRTHGRALDAEAVLIARNRALRSQRAELGGWTNRARNTLDLAWDLSAGYGFRAGRAGALLLCLVGLTTLALLLPAAGDTIRTVDEANLVYTPSGPLVETASASSATEDAPPVSCGAGRVRCFNPFFYAIDTVVPLIDLDQRSTWYPDRDAEYGRLYEWGLDFAVLLGWAVSSTLVLGLAHAFGPGRSTGRLG